MKFVEQLGDPEKPVLPLGELVSWCPGLWVLSVIDKEAIFPPGQV